MRFLLVAGSTLAACGRLGFDELGDDPPVESIELTVLAGPPAGGGAPIADAIVLFEDGTVDHTDLDGRLSIRAATPRTFHVIHPIATGWRVTSFLDVDPATTVVAGPRAFADRTSVPFTINFTPIAGATRYQLSITTRCIREDTTEVLSPPFQRISAECSGETLRGYALAFEADTPVGANAFSFTPVSGGGADFDWGPAPGLTQLSLTSVPANTEGLFLSGQVIDGDDVTATANLRIDPPFVAPASSRGAMRLPPTSVGVFAIDVSGTSTTSLIAPTPTLEVDGSQLLPYSGSMLRTTTRTVGWSAVPGIDLQRVQLLPTGAGTQWVVYAPPGVTEATFPALPAEAADAEPDATSWVAQSEAIDVLGMERRELLGEIDREWLFWNVWDARLPPGGLRVSGATTTVVP